MVGAAQESKRGVQSRVTQNIAILFLGGLATNRLTTP